MARFFWGKTSIQRREGVHPLLLMTVDTALSYGVMDMTIIEGVRSIEQQKLNVEKGVSKTMNSMHLIQPTGYAHALDIYPAPINMEKFRAGYWPEIIRFGVLAGLMKRAAQEVGCEITWGCDWDNDGQVLDHTFFDAPHFELVL